MMAADQGRPLSSRTLPRPPPARPGPLPSSRTAPRAPPPQERRVRGATPEALGGGSAARMAPPVVTSLLAARQWI